MTIHADRRSRPPPTASPVLERPALAAFSVALAYGGILWLNVLHELEGAVEAGDPPLVLHWLRDATLALPLTVFGVGLASLLARGVLSRQEGRPPRALVGAFVAAAVAAYCSVFMAVGNPVHGWLFDAHEHGDELPLAMHLLRDGVLAFGANLVLASAVAAWLLGRRRFAGRLAAGRRVAARSAVALAVLLLNAAPVYPAAPAAAAVDPGSPCPADAAHSPGGARYKHFDVTAIDVKIPLNRFGDNDPFGKMYVLNQRLAAVRAEEASQHVSIGLRDDPIQPLVVRANEDDCVDISFTNQASGGSYGLHIDGLAFQAGSSGDAVGANPISEVPQGGTAHYVFYVPNDPALEGAHHIHPGPGNRAATSHGLFGALVVEPVGSVYLKQQTTSADGVHPDAAVPLDSGWEAIIVPGTGRSFREAVQLYHEIGDESEKVFDKRGNALPQVDPFTETYRPGTRGMNYRSEPFFDRLGGPRASAEQESGAYSSYTFGDPATITPHSYQGDPMKFRILHAGSEVFHVFHLHGGGIRWPLNPKASRTWNYANTGLSKTPVVYEDSVRTDSQAFGPGESYNLEIEGGSGGVQQGAGEFLFHCHIVRHYDSGMWGFWRVFNTLQPDLAPLPDRAQDDVNGPLPVAVDSTQLIGHNYNGVTLTADNLDDWIRPQLPAQGVRNDADDAAVWNWTIDRSNPAAPLYLGEPEDPTDWPNYNKLPQFPGHPTAYPGDRYGTGANGDRPVIRFDPVNGRPAWPVLRPHVGLRMPFSGNGHTGAPYLGETVDAPPKPGVAVDPYAGHPDGLCPADAPVRHYNIVAIMPSVQVTAAGATDPDGLIFSLAQDKAGFLDGTTHPEPLAIRANIGDCVAVTLTSEQEDARTFGGHAKVNLHIHHVQFDTQASDGVIAGMEYEQSVRPYGAVDPQLTQDALVGDTVLHLTAVAKFHLGSFIGVGLGTENIEIRKIVAIDPAANRLTIDAPLTGGCAPIDNAKPGRCAPLATPGLAHRAGEWAGVEFVQERWYPDVALDNIYFHDHVDGIHGWGHGLVGQLNIEPKGSTYHDPKTGALTNGAGTFADIHVPAPPAGQTAEQAATALVPGFVEKSFREWSLVTLDDNPLTDSTLNLRAEPWKDRPGDPSDRFSSFVHGDPFTPLPRAYPGDPFVIRTLNVSQRVDGLHLDGHRFFWENRFVPTGDGKPISSPVDTIHYGVSERFTLILEGGAGGPDQKPGDYLYMNPLDRRFRDGAWGIFRVLPGLVPDLQPLPDRTAPTTAYTPPTRTGAPPPAPAGPGSVCPAGAPRHDFAVSAIDLPSNSAGAGSEGRRAAFVPTSRAASVVADRLLPEPLVLHVAAGECVGVTLTNQRASARSSFHLGGVRRDPDSSGVTVGFGSEQTVAPGQQRTYSFFVDEEQIGSAVISDFGGDASGSGTSSDEPSRDGLYGALTVAPAGATFTDPITGAATDVGASVDVHVPGAPGYRDFTLLYAEQDPTIGTDQMPYPTSVSGPALINYRSAGPRTADPVHPFSSLLNGDPQTPTFSAYVGDPVRVHLVGAPGSEQVKVPYLGGLTFPLDPNLPGSEVKSARAVGPYEKLDAHVVGGMGGVGRLVGDVLYGDRRLAYVEAGMWGLLRSLSDARCPIRPLDGRDCLGQPLPGSPPPADTTPPVLSLPADITATATGPAGAAVTYTATADDAVSGPVTPSCNPASGSTFPVGTTTVTCSATDAAGNTATGSFTVTVNPAATPVLLLGTQAVQGNVDSNPAGMAEAFQYTAAASGTVTKLSVFLDATSTASRVVVGLYADTGANNPGALLTQAAITAPVGGAFNEVAVPGTAVTAGQRYWIAVLTPSGGAGTIRFRDVAAGGGLAKTSAQTALTSLPASWATGSTFDNSPMSAYAQGA